MVSLANDSFAPSTGSRGAFFFDDLGVENDDTPVSNNHVNVHQTGGRGSINAGGDDDDDVDMLIPRRSLLTPSEDSASDSFITVKTPWVLALEALLFIGLEVAVFLVPHFLVARDHKYASPDDLPYFILLYSHGAMWFVVFVFDRILWSQHRKAQGRGYLEFYRSTRTLRQAPLFIVSLFTAVLLLVVTFLQQFPTHSSQSAPSIAFKKEDGDVLADARTAPFNSLNRLTMVQNSHESRLRTSADNSSSLLNRLWTSLDENNVVQIVVTVEIVPALMCLAVLMARTLHFNGLRHPPDVQQEEAMMQSTVPGLRGAASRDVGFRDASVLNIQDNGDFGSGRHGINVEELLEKQSDQIRYLKSHNANLSRKILRLNVELDNRNR